MNKILNYVLLVIIGILSTMLIFTLYNNKGNADLKMDAGVDAVKSLYEFSNVKQLDSNMEDLKKITTDSVFKQLTIDNTNRTLNTYLKFKGESSKVNIITSTDSYVLYSLETKYVDKDRIFMFTFSVNNKGLIDYVREMECIDFATDLN